MSAEQLALINRIVRTGWRKLAEDTEGDYDTTLETTKEVLLEKLVDAIPVE